MTKRILALLLGLILCFSVCGMAFAADGHWENDPIYGPQWVPDKPPVVNPDPIVPSNPTYTVGNGTGTSANGTWTTDKTSASQGSTVTITATPKDGYEVGTVTVKDASGKAVTVTKAADGKYTFTMPAGRVTVDVTFTPKVTVTFTDVPATAFYADAVKWAVENGITQGTSATTFSPNKPCTRSEMVEFLYRVKGKPAVSGSNAFTDIPSDAYYKDAVQWAVDNGITQGTSTTTFSPDKPCSRSEMVTFLHRLNSKPEATGTNQFTDVPADAYYKTAVQWAVNTGITQGTSATTFEPNRACTRGEMVEFLYRNSKL